MKNGEGTGSAKLAKEDAEGEHGTLRGIPFDLLDETQWKVRTALFMLTETFSRRPAAMQETPPRTMEATFEIECITDSKKLKTDFSSISPSMASCPRCP